MRRIIAKFTTVAFLMSAVAFCLIGCGGGGYKTDDRGIYTEENGIKTYQLTVYDHGTVLPAAPPYRKDVLREINARLYETYGYHVNFKTYSFPDDSFFEKINVELAGGTSIDLVRQNHREVIVRNYRKDIAKDISSYLESASNLKATASEKVWDEFTFDDGIYAIPLSGMPTQTTIWARGDMLIKIGYVDEQGNPRVPQTLAELEDALIKMRDGGVLKGANTVPLAATLEDLEKFLLGCFTDTPGDWLDEEGVIRNKYEHESYKQFLSLLKRWYDAELIDSQLFSGTSSAAQLLQRGAIGMYAGTVSDIQWGNLKRFHSANPEQKYCAILPPEDVKKIKSEGFSQEYLWVPYTSQSTQVAIEFLEFAYSSIENYELVFYGIEDLTYVKGGGSGMEYDIPAEEIEYGANLPLDLMGMFIPGGGSNELYLERVNSRTTSELAKETMTYYLQISEEDVYVPPTTYFANVLGTIMDDHQGNLEKSIKRSIRSFLETKYSVSETESALANLSVELENTMATPKNGSTVYGELNAIYSSGRQEPIDYTKDIRNFKIMIAVLIGAVAIIITLLILKKYKILGRREK